MQGSPKKTPSSWGERAQWKAKEKCGEIRQAKILQGATPQL